MGSGARRAWELYHLPGFHEPFSAMSHLLGAVVFLILGVMLVARGRGDRTRVAFLTVYAASCVCLFAVSGVYHMVTRSGTAHRVMARIDHGAIFLLIAGTCTAVHGLLFRGWLRWGPLALIWACAITGITLKTIFFDSLAEWIGLSFYLTLGWFGGLSVVLLARRHGIAFVKPVVLGGLAYTVGGIMEFRDLPVLLPRVVHAHEVFHVAVLAGALLHWQFVWKIADGSDPATMPANANEPARAPERQSRRAFFRQEPPASGE